jgi:hypothetical protein
MDGAAIQVMAGGFNSPQQAHFQQSAFLYERQQNQIVQAAQARRPSLQIAHPSNLPSQRPVASPTMAAPYHTMNNVSIPQNVFNSSMTGQMGHSPPAPVLQSSSTGAMPPSQMVQSMQSPRAYAQGGPKQQQYSLSNHQVQAQNMQSVQYINPCTQNMVSVHQAAAQQQWPTERYMSTNQQMSASLLASSPRVISGHNTNPRPQAPQ